MHDGKQLVPVLLGFVVLCCVYARGQDPEQANVAAGAGYGVIGASLARAEEAICRSIVNYNSVRGAFGEEVMERVVLRTRRAGEWQSISVSPKPQGIDGLYIKRDSAGRPRALLVGEAKFGASQLGMTKDGPQLSDAWTKTRLAFESSRYNSAGSAASVELRARPRGLAQNPDVVRVRLPDGRDAYFWRNSNSDPWNYDGPQGTLNAARHAAVRDARFLQAAADGKITYRQRLFKVDVNRNTISVKILDVNPASPRSVPLKKIDPVKIDAATRMSYMKKTKDEIASQLMKRLPHLTEEDAKTIAATATSKMRNLETILLQQRRAYWLSVLSDGGKASVAGGALAGALDVAAQMYSKGQVDWGEAGGMAFIGAGSAGTGALAHHLVVGTAINNAFYAQIAKAVGLPTGMAAASIVGQGAGGAVGSIVFAAMMYCSGNMEGGDAARMAFAGTAGSFTGMAAGGGLVVFATMYGTAGTGAAISSLSGAAAHSAAIAWLGGGSLAAGGGGMALGSIVISGGIAVVAVATTAAITWGLAEWDDSETNHRHQYNAGNFLNDERLLQELCKRRWFPNVSATQ